MEGGSSLLLRRSVGEEEALCQQREGRCFVSIIGKKQLEDLSCSYDVSLQGY